MSKYLLEARTGIYLADVYQSSVFPIMNLLEKGLLARYYSPEREAYIEALRDKDGYWNGMYLNALTIAYNTRMLKPDEVPTANQQSSSLRSLASLKVLALPTSETATADQFCKPAASRRWQVY